MPERDCQLPALSRTLDVSTLSGQRLAEALARDFQKRWHAGDPISIESYLKLYPELDNDPEALLDLIYNDWALREHYGKSLVLEEYIERFPDLAESLRMQWEVHQVCKAARRETSRTPFSESSTPILSPRETRQTRGVQLIHVPGYEILEILGKGGMGIVYKARHLALDRIVALKMIRNGVSADPEELARFQKEAEAVARLQHPNIVQVFEVANWEPADGSPSVPYLSLEYMAGGSLAQQLARDPLPAAEAAKLVETLARAVEHAHQRHIIHRDLKPANILFHELATDEHRSTQIRDTRDPSSICVHLRSSVANSVPKITDFGLAKRLDSQGDETRTGAVLGTPSYMAPEQADGRTREIGPAADIYALGAILYESLTGRPPFKGTSVLETLEQVRTLEPVTPRQLQPGLPRDLETICLKCLAKEPAKRYATAADLAEDLARFQRGEPILARPTPAWERAWKAIKRRPTISSLAALVAITAIAGFLGILGQWLRAERNAAAQRLANYDSSIMLAQREMERGNTRRVQDLLDRLVPAGGEADLRSFEWYYLHGLCHGEERTLPGRDAVALTPDGRTIAGGGEAGQIRIWNWDGVLLCTLSGHQGAITTLAFSPDGKLLASAGKDNAVKVWDWHSGDLYVTLPMKHTDWPLALAFHPDGRKLASGGKDGRIIIWDLANGRTARETPVGKGAITSLAFSPEQPFLAATTTAEQVWRWDWQAEQPPTLFAQEATDAGRGLSFSPDGRYLATAGGKDVPVWDWKTRKRMGHLQGHEAGTTCVAFAGSGNWLITAGWDRTLRVWDLSGGMDRTPAPLVLHGHTGCVTALGVDRTGKRLASVGADHTIRLWNLDQSRPECAICSGLGRRITCLAYSADGSRLAMAGYDGTVRLRDLDTGSVAEFRDQGKLINGVALSTDGILLAAANDDGTLSIWDVQRHLLLHTVPAHSNAAMGVAFQPHTHVLASAGWDGRVRTWEADSGKAIVVCQGHEGPVHALAYSPDGARLASAGADGSARLWDDSGEEVMKIRAAEHEEELLSVAFNLDGSRLAAGCKDSSVLLWNTRTGRLEAELTGHDGSAVAVAFHPQDGRRLATAGSEGSVRLWDLDTMQELLTLAGCAGETTSLAFRPDGQEFAAAGGTIGRGEIRFWSAAPGNAYP
jgi:WD40 repeat protein/serine/threonine protein kinase